MSIEYFSVINNALGSAQLPSFSPSLLKTNNSQVLVVDAKTIVRLHLLILGS